RLVLLRRADEQGPLVEELALRPHGVHRLGRQPGEAEPRPHLGPLRPGRHAGQRPINARPQARPLPLDSRPKRPSKARGRGMADDRSIGTARVKRGLAEMLRGGVIMDVVTAEQARIAEDAGAVAVMALERVPADIRRDGGVARMSDPAMIESIKA